MDSYSLNNNNNNNENKNKHINETGQKDKG